HSRSSDVQLGGSESAKNPKLGEVVGNLFTNEPTRREDQHLLRAQNVCCCYQNRCLARAGRHRHDRGGVAATEMCGNGMERARLLTPETGHAPPCKRPMKTVVLIRKVGQGRSVSPPLRRAPKSISERR